jgi:molybdenum cofactor synthesis domain-containing protein
MEKEQEITAAYVGIGNEILSGSIQDANFHYLAQALRELGVRLMRGIVIPDEQEVIRETLDLLRGRFDYIFTSGGLGPTHDDVTIEGVALALGVPVVRHPHLEAKIREYYGDDLDEAALKMAEIPEGAELHVHGEMSFPILSIENIYLFPGIPQLFRRKFEGIRERFRTRPYHTEEIFTGRHESEIASLLSETLEEFPSIQIGSYPLWDEKGHQVKLVLESKQRESVERAAAHLRKALE